MICLATVILDQGLDRDEEDRSGLKCFNGIPQLEHLASQPSRREVRGQRREIRSYALAGT